LTDWDLTISNPAERYLKRLSVENQERIIRALKLLLADRYTNSFKIQGAGSPRYLTPIDNL
jgi:hypothetical protein